MALSPTAHVDTTCRERLPPESSWPEFLFELPELRYPDRLNCATALLDDVVAEHGPDRPCLLEPTGSAWSYGHLLATANRIAHLLVDRLGVVPGTACSSAARTTPGWQRAGSAC